MAKRYEVIVSRKAEHMLTGHIGFLARVSVSAARRLREEFAGILDAMEDSPYQFPPADEPDIPEGYRKALFGKRYLAVFCVEESTVYLEAVLDRRMDNSEVF